jgi:hypothetical protein
MEKGTCPVCNGTGKHQDRECRNCGGQYMYGKATGLVKLNREGVPCTHSYRGETVGRCLTDYTCIHCGERHQIDSGD